MVDGTSLGTPEENSVSKLIDELVTLSGGNPKTFEGELVTQIVETALKTIKEGHDVGQMKLIARSLKEMRYAYRIFNQYVSRRRVSIFGSARTPEDHPDYEAAKAFGAGLGQQGWMVITGAARGIMQAGLEGLPRESSFGLSISLPFEDVSNALIHGDPKLISFRYFFTRKLMFMSHSDALAAFPGGFGTQDELFEMLTLMQTGKANVIPVVLVEGEGGRYWENWEKWLRENLFHNGWISETDFNFLYRAPSPEMAIEHILHFYKRFHSYRYVRDMMVIRIHGFLSDGRMKELNRDFKELVSTGEIIQCGALEEESDHLELVRIVFHHTRRNFGLLRKLIDVINES